MAKNFNFKTNGFWCEDNCSTNLDARTGSVTCQNCKFCSNYNFIYNTLDCPKIIYRNQITDKVVMRKN